MSRLTPVAEVAARLVADKVRVRVRVRVRSLILTLTLTLALTLSLTKGMVGLHVRHVFDAPRDAATAKVPPNPYPNIYPNP